MHSLRTDSDELMDRLSSIWRLLKMLLHENSDGEKVVFSNCVCFSLFFYREEIRELQSNLDYLSSRFSQSQYVPTSDRGICGF